MRVLVRDVMKAAAFQVGLTPKDMECQGRTAVLVRPRQRAMYVACEVTGASLPAIGRQFGGRDHTTVLHAKRRVAERLETDLVERALVDDLLALFRPTIVSTIALVRAETEALAA